MIKKIKHKGLKKLYETGSRQGVKPEHAAKLRRILAALDACGDASHMDRPGFKLHPLKADLKGFWGVSVSGNWRVVFRFENGNATDVDYLDYH